MVTFVFGGSFCLGIPKHWPFNTDSLVWVVWDFTNLYNMKRKEPWKCKERYFPFPQATLHLLMTQMCSLLRFYPSKWWTELSSVVLIDGTCACPFTFPQSLSFLNWCYSSTVLLIFKLNLFLHLFLMHINEFNDSFGESYMFWDAMMGKSYI